MNILELLFCYWVITFMLIFILFVDVAKRSPKFFYSHIIGIRTFGLDFSTNKSSNGFN